ncbi:MAG: hypothetical protein PHQ90_06560 [Sulfuricurvum sp.]|uniref:hypothetical protein n=1 Tax=Sulfuricurvum sp. TaxID=2025608 RepID=UPI002601B144|nr:hypothetical protein [Sulfuricurvum sp.]MDD2368948.1 hypothetical protein [Sulfuricurvum sp.]MDD5119295.1 hypothetical protein [Sulfuricurvum sp.]
MKFRVALIFSLFAVLPITLSAAESKKHSAVKDAVTAPLSDLNLIHVEIPPVLIEAQKEPYRVPIELSCDALSLDVEELDNVLGPDLDAAKSDSNTTLLQKGVSRAESAAVGTLRNTTESVIPYRGWVRKLSGADRYSKKVTASITAGTVRRAFLKGIMASKECIRTSSN